MRKYIRHPTDVPIIYELESVVKDKKEYLSDISVGGLLFKSNMFIDSGTVINIKIPLSHPIFELNGRVVWCRQKTDYYDVGVEFINADDAYRTRLIEQICYIESYKNKVLREEGRLLSGEEAATEWIGRYAADFPQFIKKHECLSRETISVTLK